MTQDLFLILNNKVSGGKLTEEQAKKIGNRYLEIQAMGDFTDGEKSAIFRAYVSQVIWPNGNPEGQVWVSPQSDDPGVKESDSSVDELKAWQEASRKDIVKNLKKIEGQQVLF